MLGSRSFLAGGLLTLVLGASSASFAQKLDFKVLGSYGGEVYRAGSAEIVAYDHKGQRLYVVNGADNAIDVLDLKDPTTFKKLMSLSMAPYGKGANSVAVHGDVVAAAVEADSKQAPGKLVVMDRDGGNVRTVTVGALPDMVTITPNGKYALVANEGEPSDDYKVDPEGTVSIVRLSDLRVRTITFGHLKRSDFGRGAHFPSPKGTTLAQDIEPEYIAVSQDSRTAFVTLQENNAVAVIDIERALLTRVFALGFKDFSRFDFDVSDTDKKINMRKWPVKGLYQPDSIATFVDRKVTYLVTANEGDARDYKGYSEEARVAELKLDETVFPNASELQKNDQLGRLKVTKAQGDTGGNGIFKELVTFGGRSFSIWTADGKLVWDSGNEFSRILAERHPTWANSQGQESTFDSRSDDKGEEPEGLAIGMLRGKRHAFIGLERMGGVMIYDLSNPRAPTFVEYVHNSNPKGEVKAKTAGDVAPEGVIFIEASKSPTGHALLVTASEVSGTTTVYEIK